MPSFFGVSNTRWQTLPYFFTNKTYIELLAVESEALQKAKRL